MTDHDTLQLKVQGGCEILDDILPSWYKMINIEHLDMQLASPVTNGKGCILCQLDKVLSGQISPQPEPLQPEEFGYYTRGIETLQNSIEDFVTDLHNSDMLGFDPESGNERDYKTLTELWTREIKFRLAKDR